MSKHKKKRKRSSATFKAEAVRLVEERGDLTISDLVESLGVAEYLIHTSKRKHDPMRSNDRGGTPAHELKRLRRENAQLRRALRTRRPAAEPIEHCDRGSQYAGRQYRKLLTDHQVAFSTSRAGYCQASIRSQRASLHR